MTSTASTRYSRDESVSARIVGLAATLTALVLIAGCATPGSVAEPADPSTVSAEPGTSAIPPAENIEYPPSFPCPDEPVDNSDWGDRALPLPESLAELAAQAEAVVVAQATSDITHFPVGEPDIVMTVTRLEVLQTLAGQLKQPVVRLQQIGTPDACVNVAGTFVVPGQTYVLFLKPQILVPADGPLEDYVMTNGPVGHYSLDDGILTSLDPTVASTLPDELTLTEFVAALG